MKLQTAATQVALRTSQLIRAGTSKGRGGGLCAINEPVWYRVVLTNPPTSAILPRARQLKEYIEKQRPNVQSQKDNGFYLTRCKYKYSTNGGHLYKMPKIKYVEDQIRRLFYSNHPWELARPRSVLESNGKTHVGRDWSSLRQDGLRLSGESVVQRTLWLAEQPSYKKVNGNDWYNAYCQARLEFYRLRMEEHAEEMVAAEEAIMSGAVFGPSALEYGAAAEQRVIDQYINEAIEATQVKRAKLGSASSPKH